jgi:hypothetical protein
LQIFHLVEVLQRCILEVSPAFECKRSLNPVPARGFHEACKDLEPRHRFVIYPGRESIPLGRDVEGISLPQAVAALRAL